MREHDAWTLSLLVREAVRNVLARRSRLFPVVALAILLGSAQVAVAAHQSQSFAAQVEALQQKGRNVLSITSGETPTIDRQSCEALTTLDAVTRAGIRTENAPTVDFSQLGPNIPLRSVSTTLVPELSTHDIIVGRGLAKASQLGGASTFSLAGETGQVLDAYVSPTLGAEMSSTSALFVAADPSVTLATTCIVVLDRRADARQVLPVALASLTVDGPSVTGSTLMNETVNVTDLYLKRVERWLPLLLGVIGGLAVAAISGLRSSELAAYRLSGTSPRSLGMLLAFEQLLVAGLFVTASTITALLLRADLTSAAATVGWSIAAGMAWLVCGALAGLPVLRRAPTDMAKDR